MGRGRGGWGVGLRQWVGRMTAGAGAVAGGAEAAGWAHDGRG